MALALLSANRMCLLRRGVFFALLVFALCPACSNTIAMGRLDHLAPEQATEQAKHVVGELGSKPASVLVGAPEDPDTAVDTSLGKLSVLDERAFVLRVPGQEDVRIPFDQTRQITFKDRPLGGLGGATLGLAGGALAGIGVSLLYNFWESADCTLNSPYWSDSDSNYNRPSSCDSRIERRTGMLVGAAVGATLGAIIGAVIGQRTYVTF